MGLKFSEIDETKLVEPNERPNKIRLGSATFRLDDYPQLITGALELGVVKQIEDDNGTEMDHFVLMAHCSFTLEGSDLDSIFDKPITSRLEFAEKVREVATKKVSDNGSLHLAYKTLNRM